MSAGHASIGFGSAGHASAGPTLGAFPVSVAAAQSGARTGEGALPRNRFMTTAARAAQQAQKRPREFENPAQPAAQQAASAAGQQPQDAFAGASAPILAASAVGAAPTEPRTARQERVRTAGRALLHYEAAVQARDLLGARDDDLRVTLLRLDFNSRIRNAQHAKNRITCADLLEALNSLHAGGKTARKCMGGDVVQWMVQDDRVALWSDLLQRLKGAEGGAPAVLLEAASDLETLCRAPPRGDFGRARPWNKIPGAPLAPAHVQCTS